MSAVLEEAPVVDEPVEPLDDRLYVGRRLPPLVSNARGPCFLAVIDNGRERQIELRDGGPSPTGFEWSYAGSGPAETARAILWEHLGREPERSLFEAFKFAFIAAAPFIGFGIAAVEIDAWLVLQVSR